MPRDLMRWLARLFAGLLITAGTVAVGAELFMWYWDASSATRSQDIQARGPFLWAMLPAPLALLAGAMCASAAAYLTSRSHPHAGWVGAAVGLFGAAGAIALAIVAPGALYIGTHVPAALGRWPPLVLVGAEIALGIGLLSHLGSTESQRQNAEDAQAAV